MIPHLSTRIDVVADVGLEVSDLEEGILVVPFVPHTLLLDPNQELIPLTHINEDLLFLIELLHEAVYGDLAALLALIGLLSLSAPALCPPGLLDPDGLLVSQHLHIDALPQLLLLIHGERVQLLLHRQLSTRDLSDGDRCLYCLWVGPALPMLGRD